MSERTATFAIEALDKDRHAVDISVRMIMNILYDYIPRACQREAEHKLFDELFINGTELTSNLMRKEYEQWKRTQIDMFILKPSTGVQP